MYPQVHLLDFICRDNHSSNGIVHVRGLLGCRLGQRRFQPVTLEFFCENLFLRDQKNNRQWRDLQRKRNIDQLRMLRWKFFGFHRCYRSLELSWHSWLSIGVITLGQITSQNPLCHSTTKHVVISYNFIWEWVTLILRNNRRTFWRKLTHSKHSTIRRTN